MILSSELTVIYVAGVFLQNNKTHQYKVRIRKMVKVKGRKSCP